MARQMYQSQTDLSLLRDFKRRAEAVLPGRIDHMTLFGSRARGTARPVSDWDVAVFFKDNWQWADLQALSAVSYDMLLQSGCDIQFVPLSPRGAHVEQALRDAIQRDGLPL